MTIDALRIFGLLLIILAHVNPPYLIFQLRTFDVPLMIFVSGMSFFVSQKKDINIIHYSLSRFKRLVLPVWAFLSFFFISIYLIRPDGFIDLLNPKIIFLTYRLDGFGYVWIIKIFLIIAILSPLYVYITERKNGYLASIISLMLLFLGLILSELNHFNKINILSRVIMEIIIPAISYGAVFIIGYRYNSFTPREKTFSFILFFVAISTYVIINYARTNSIIGPQEFKYPPTLYYIAYSLVMIFIIYFLVNKLLRNIALPDFALKISSNTIWIYLWHIPIVETFKRYDIEISFITKYLIAIILPIAITFIQLYLVKRFFSSSKIIKTIFTG